MTVLLGLASALGGIAAQAAPETAKAAKEAVKVTMYVMPHCGYCEKARQQLARRGVQWQELDILASDQARQEFTAHGGVGTPLLLIGDSVIKGVDPARIDAALRASGLLAQ
ncbi:glutaredoxin family protein [Tahibacter harae]|uniref:Glutaredoxin family protein n=1 Tax=Tahibacter harae TaxID=2963937 RepID=A0ABT1QXB2_9GAMM|nr:glutaredoxin family protein [Tahibacter harae]MCQ4166926.1 glutaredoxin family protein [Tahibacter harae]